MTHRTRQTLETSVFSVRNANVTSRPYDRCDVNQMETIIVIGVGLTTVGFAMALLLAASKRPKRVDERFVDAVDV